MAWRIIRARKSRFLNVISVVAIVGIGFGVMMLTIVLSVTGGFQESFRERILGLHPHLLVWPRDDQFTDYRVAMEQLKQDPRILGATPATYDEMMLAHGDHRAGAVIKGVDYGTIGEVLDIQTLTKEGRLEELDETPVLARDGPDIRITNLVQETSWTLVLWGDQQMAVYLDRTASPLPDEAHVTIVHAAPDLGAIDIAIRDAKNARASALKPGEASRPVILPAGTVGLDIGDKALGEDLELASGKTYIYVLKSGGIGELLQVATARPSPGEARVRLVDARSDTSVAVNVTASGTAVALGTTQTVPGRQPIIVLGSSLAERLDAAVGDRIAVSSSNRGLGDRGMAPMGMMPTSGRFRVAAIFQSGYHDYDNRFALVAFSAAARFLNTGDRAKWLEVRVDDVLHIDSRRQAVQDILQPYSLSTFSDDVQISHTRMDAVLKGEVSQFDIEPKPEHALGLLRNAAQVLTVMRTSMPHTFSRENNYSVLTWREVNEPLFQALKLQKLVLSIFFLIIIVVAAFNIVGTQIMMVHQKTREISILKALGSDRWRVRKVFLIQGFIVASLGTLSGLFFGLGACLVLDRIGYPLEPEVYLIDKLPVQIDLMEIGLVCVAALLLTFCATLYSAGRAARLMPVEGIRYIE